MVPALAAWFAVAVCLPVSPGAIGVAGAAAVVAAAGLGAVATVGGCTRRGWLGLGALSIGAVGLVLVSLGGQGALARTAPLVAAAVRGESVRVELSVDQVPRSLGPSQFGGGERIAVEGSAREVVVVPDGPDTPPTQGRRYARLGGRPARVVAFIILDGDPGDCSESGTHRARDASLASDVSSTGGARPADGACLSGDAESADGVGLGDILILRGRAVPGEAADRARVILPGASIESVRPPTEWRGVVSRLRQGLMRAAATVPGDAGALIPGIAIGDLSAVPKDLDQAMKGSSLTHITAVSGAHVAIVLGAVLVLAAAVRAPRAVRVGLGVIALGGFVALVGPGPSVLRSALMGAVTLLALGLGRRRAALGALGASVLVLLAADPWMAREYGFALSVVATAALIVLAPGWQRALERHAPRVLAAAVAVPAAAQAACGPIIVLFAGQVSVVGVVANLAVIPAVPLATTSGVVACLLAPLGGWWLEVPLRLAAVGSGWIAWVARWSTSLPGSVLAWPAGVVGAVALVGVTVGGLAGGRWVTRRRRRRWVAGVTAVIL
ncbi:MAG: ComEC/Rec2 family competence protein, partial [Bifidobacteriaceae bacterium]|nr:ComEC/Rec2 family competence protein [Bifidobacteriaceae bacterium]